MTFARVLAVLFSLILTQGAFADVAPAPPPSPEQSLRDVRAAAAGANALGDNLLADALRRTKDTTVVVSPINVWTALAMAAQGADKATFAAFRRTLGVPKPAGEIAAAQRALWRALSPAPAAGGVTLSPANGVWLQSGPVFVPEFTATMHRQFGATVAQEDFRDPNTLVRINKFVAQKTNDQIPHIIDTLPADSGFVLISALHLKAMWQTPFDLKRSAPMAFTQRPGQTLSVDGMSMKGSFGMARKGGLTVVALPFKDDRFEMVVVLPDLNRAGLIAKGMSRSVAGFLEPGALPPQSIDLTMPKLNLTWGADLAGPLKAIGLAAAFGAKADFTKLSPDRGLRLGQVVHKTVFTADETGAEASAATAVLGTRGMPHSDATRIVVDRPFLMIVRERTTGAALFMGVVFDPGTRAKS